jgi:hypothetical protein
VNAGQLLHYRPISIFSVLSKIFEIAMKNQLMEFLIKNKIINSNQFGFLKNSSTTGALVQLVYSTQSLTI